MSATPTCSERTWPGYECIRCGAVLSPPHPEFGPEAVWIKTGDHWPCQGSMNPVYDDQPGVW